MNYRKIFLRFSILGCVIASRVSQYDMFPCSVSSPFGLGSFRCVTVSFIDSSISTVTQETVISTASGLSIQSYSDDVDHRGMPDGFIGFSDGFRVDSNFIIDMSPVGYVERLPQLGFDFGGTIVNQIDKFILTPTKLVLDFNPDDMSLFCESSTDENGRLGWVNLAGGFNDWIVRAQVTVEHADNIPEQSFFMVHSGSLVSILPDEEYDVLMNRIRGVGGVVEEFGDPGERFIRIQNCQEILEYLPALYISLHSGEYGPAVVLGISATDYVSEQCVLTIQGESSPNIVSYPTIGENIVRHMTVAFDKSNRKIGFCDPN